MYTALPISRLTSGIRLYCAIEGWMAIPSHELTLSPLSWFRDRSRNLSIARDDSPSGRSPGRPERKGGERQVESNFVIVEEGSLPSRKSHARPLRSLRCHGQARQASSGSSSSLRVHPDGTSAMTPRSSLTDGPIDPWPESRYPGPSSLHVSHATSVHPLLQELPSG